MILDVLVFALGFLVAGLLSLAALPAVWRRALRLSGERLSRLVPLSPAEMAAERDHLRAAHAVDLRRTEQRAERAEADRSALRIEAARRDGDIVALHEAARRAEAKIAGLVADLTDARRANDGLQAEIGAEAMALHGLSTLAENRLLTIAALQSECEAARAERDALAEQVDRGRSSLAGLETRLIGAETGKDDLRRELEQARRDVTAAAERLAAASAERPPDPERPNDGPAEDLRAVREAHAHEIEGLTAELAFMTEQAASAERRAAEATRMRQAESQDTGSRDAEAPIAATDGSGGIARDGDLGRLRAAIAALADDVLRLGARAE